MRRTCAGPVQILTLQNPLLVAKPSKECGISPLEIFPLLARAVPATQEPRPVPKPPLRQTPTPNPLDPVRGGLVEVDVRVQQKAHDADDGGAPLQLTGVRVWEYVLCEEQAHAAQDPREGPPFLASLRGRCEC